MKKGYFFRGGKLKADIYIKAANSISGKIDRVGNGKIAKTKEIPKFF